MKKLIAVIFSLFFLGSTYAVAEIGIGITGNFASLDTDGKEVEISGNKETNTGSHSEDILVPEVFVEFTGDNGFAFGASYIPSRELGSKTRTDADGADAAENDDGNSTAKAELDNLWMVYTDIPVGPVYAHLGYFEADIETTESLPNSTYGNKSVDGYQLGVGMEINDNASVEFMYTDIDEFTLTSTSGSSSVTADPEIMTLRLKYTFGG